MMGYWGRHEQVYGVLQDFHAYFGLLFGRREALDHSRHYLQALQVQSGERRNAENLSETVPASAKAMQRFLTESPWQRVREKRLAIRWGYDGGSSLAKRRR